MDYTSWVNIVSIFVIFRSASIQSDVPRPRGVLLSMAALYSPDKDFTCFDGETTIQFSRVNDDYCDCSDGSDEPGTSACPNGVFQCTNAGFRPKNIPSSRVNDGVCDCCDGTDEYATGALCANNCEDFSKRAAAFEKFRNATTELRLKLIEEGIKRLAEMVEQLPQLEKEKEKAKEKEIKAKEVMRIYLELEETKKLTEAETKRRAVKADSNSENISSGNEIDVDSVDNIITPNDEAAEAREELAEAERHAREIEDKVNYYRHMLTRDYGEQKAFVVLDGKCFKYLDKETNYDYQLCLFHNVTQRTDDKKTVLLLGKWTGWGGDEFNYYSIMKYTDGDFCRGEYRSTMVNLKCAMDTKILSVTEPMVCYYEIEFSTPAACDFSIQSSHDEL